VNKRDEVSEKSNPEKKEKVRYQKETIKYILKLNLFCMAVLQQGYLALGQFPEKAIYTCGILKHEKKKRCQSQDLRNFLILERWVSMIAVNVINNLKKKNKKNTVKYNLNGGRLKSERNLLSVS